MLYSKKQCSSMFKMFLILLHHHKVYKTEIIIIICGSACHNKPTIQDVITSSRNTWYLSGILEKWWIHVAEKHNIVIKNEWHIQHLTPTGSQIYEKHFWWVHNLINSWFLAAINLARKFLKIWYHCYRNKKYWQCIFFNNFKI